MRRAKARRGNFIPRILAAFAVAMLASLALAGCDFIIIVPTTTTTLPSATVYVAGYYGTGTSDSTACYWIGTTRYDLPSAGFPAEAVSIFVKPDSTVLVSGSYKDGSNYYHASQWLNGARTDLFAPYTSDDVRAVSVFAYGADIYHAGYYYRNSLSRFVACYWENGTAHSLPVPGTEFAKAAAVAVDSAHVYVVGFHAVSDEIACIWEDGVLYNLEVPITATKSRAYSVMTEGGDTYVAGYYKIGSTNYACVWINGARVDLDSGASASSVFCDGYDYYTAGYMLDSGISTASLWTDSTYQEYLPGTVGHLSGASGVYALDGSTYVSGFYANASDMAVACYWKDGARTNLPSAGLAAFGMSVFAR